MRLVFPLLFFILLVAERGLGCEKDVTLLLEKATEARESGKYRVAIHLYRGIEEKAKKCLKDSILIFAEVHYFLGSLYAQMDAADSALYYYGRALPVNTEGISVADKRVAKIYNGMASVYRYTLYDYQKAEEYFLKAYEWIEK